MNKINLWANELILTGEFNIQAVEDLKNNLEALLQQSSGNIVLNIEQVISFDTAILQLLMAFKKEAEWKQNSVTIKMNSKIGRILALSGLGKHFN